MSLIVNPGQPVLMATIPLPPSTNALDKPVPRTRKDGTVYATKIKDPAVIAYELQLKTLLNYPQPPWKSWVDRALVRELQRHHGILLDFDLWLYFTDNRSDADNRVKALQDMLARYIDINDKRVVNPSQHKRVHPKCIPHAVAVLRIAEPVDIWAEQAELDEMIEKYRNEEKTAKSQVVLR